MTLTLKHNSSIDRLCGAATSGKTKASDKRQRSSNCKGSVNWPPCRFCAKEPKSIRLCPSPKFKEGCAAAEPALCFSANSNCPKLLLPALFSPKKTVSGANFIDPVSCHALKFLIRQEVIMSTVLLQQLSSYLITITLLPPNQRPITAGYSE